jgi:hypothetical protein
MSEENKLEFNTPTDMISTDNSAVPDTAQFFPNAEEATKIAYTAFRSEIKKILSESMNRGINEIELPVTAVDKVALETLKDELVVLGYKATISSKYSNRPKGEQYQGKSGSETILTIRY